MNNKPEAGAKGGVVLALVMVISAGMLTACTGDTAAALFSRRLSICC